jgi:hypothetical protein
LYRPDRAAAVANLAAHSSAELQQATATTLQQYKHFYQHSWQSMSQIRSQVGGKIAGFML